jgi:hypothetical protein
MIVSMKGSSSMALAFRMAAVAVATLALAACQTPPPPPVAAAPPMPPPPQNLTAAEIKSAFVGNTQKGESINGIFLIYMAPNGAIRGKFDLGQDRGKWHITDDGKLCANWRGLFGHHESCRTVQRKGSGYVMIEPEGEISATVTVIPGNPDKI